MHVAEIQIPAFKIWTSLIEMQILVFVMQISIFLIKYIYLHFTNTDICMSLEISIFMVLINISIYSTYENLVSPLQIFTCTVPLVTNTNMAEGTVPASTEQLKTKCSRFNTTISLQSNPSLP